ncbi:MAG: ABC transporter ATP-binding protein [Desulfobacteraceae bacterium]|nr:ABC transporter ATP-binding protein [Desulfobacteraceae bacterium]
MSKPTGAAAASGCLMPCTDRIPGVFGRWRAGEMIRIEKLAKRFKGVEALKGVSLRVGEGELFAYLGPNGSGKTTTIKILTGLAVPTSGDAWLHGFHVERDGLQAKRQCGLVPQNINLDNELTVAENLHLHGKLFQMPKKERGAKISELLDYIELSERRDSPVKSLSGGMRRRVMIARALMHSPRILFLDEPTAGLDPAIRRRIWSLVKKIQQSGTTIFLTTHYIEEAEFLAERVAFLDEGRIVALDSPQSLMAGLGAWAMDVIADGEMRTLYFRSREEAKGQVSRHEGGFSLRRVNLEDVFISVTGKRVLP